MGLINTLINKSTNINLKYHIYVVIFFTILYHTLAMCDCAPEDIEAGNFTHIGASLYFTIITHSTVGFGDISPKSSIMRTLCCVQIIIVFLLLNF